MEMSKNTDAITLLEKNFDIAFAAPDGIKKLRELILSLAMQGKLVPQDNNDQPAIELLKQIVCKRNYLSEIKSNEYQSLLPTSWRWVRVADIFELKSGYSFPKDEELQSGTYMYLKVGEMNTKGNEIVITSTSIFLNESTRVINALIPKNSIIFPKRGGAIATNKKRLVIEPICVDTNIMAIICPKNIDLNFVYHWILSIDLAKLNSGTSVPQINNKDIYPLLFPLPPLAEQRRIVAKIDELMARCDELEKLKAERNQKQITVHKSVLNRLLTAKDHSDFKTSWHFITQHFGELYSVKENVAGLRKAILQLAVMGKLVPQDNNDQPASELLKEIEKEKQKLIKEGKIKSSKPLPEIKPDEIPYDLPKGWEWVRVIDLVDVGTGSTPATTNSEYYNGNIPWYTSSATNDSVAKIPETFITEQALRETNCKIFPSGSLIIAMYGQGKTRGQISEIVLAGATNQAIAAMVFYESSKELKKYIKYYFVKIYEEIRSIAEGAAQPNLNVGKIKETLIPLPPLAEQHRIVAKIEQLMTLCNELEKQIDAAESKQTNLLNSMMTKV